MGTAGEEGSCSRWTNGGLGFVDDYGSRNVIPLPYHAVSLGCQPFILLEFYSPLPSLPWFRSQIHTFPLCYIYTKDTLLSSRQP